MCMFTWLQVTRQSTWIRHALSNYHTTDDDAGCVTLFPPFTSSHHQREFCFKDFFILRNRRFQCFLKQMQRQNQKKQKIRSAKNMYIATRIFCIALVLFYFYTPNAKNRLLSPSYLLAPFSDICEQIICMQPRRTNLFFTFSETRRRALSHHPSAHCEPLSAYNFEGMSECDRLRELLSF